MNADAGCASRWPPSTFPSNRFRKNSRRKNPRSPSNWPRRPAAICNLPRARVAVCGLNPHAGEGGQFGDEEIKTITPAVLAAQKRGLDVVGPLSGDTVFHYALQGDFDVVVAMYHDQGLAPLKAVAFDTGVNWTLGLPFIRTSPDHGTAYDIAGKGIANPSSMISAIRLAKQLALNKSRRRGDESPLIDMSVETRQPRLLQINRSTRGLSCRCLRRASTIRRPKSPSRRISSIVPRRRGCECRSRRRGVTSDACLQLFRDRRDD